MTRIYKLALAGLATLGAIAMSSAPAGAATGYANLCPVLKTAFCAESSLGLTDIAVDNSTGPSAGGFWAASRGNDALIEFDASGSKLAEVGNSDIPSPAQRFGNLLGVAVDPADGDVYAADAGSRTVTKFDASGVFQFQIDVNSLSEGFSSIPVGLAVDPSTGDLYVGVQGGEDEEQERLHDAIYKFSPAGVYLGRLAIPIPLFADYTTLAVDSAGNLYVGTSRGLTLDGESIAYARVSEYSSTGAPVDCPSGSNVIYENPPPEEFARGAAVAIDPSSGHIFIAEATELEEGFIAEYSTPCTQPRAILGMGEFKGGNPAGVGVGAVAGRAYAVARTSTTEAGVIFGQVTVPDVTTAALATGITRSAARVSGTVDPDGTSVTKCEFEYGTSTAYGRTAPCEQALPLTGNGPVAVSAELKFALPPDSIVHYRLKSSNDEGSGFGEDESLRSEALPVPVVGGLPASSVSQFGVTLNGSLRAGEAVVNYHFEYGPTTAYGQVAPVPDSYAPMGGGQVTVSQPVDGLQAGTTYHYRLVASSPGGTDVAGPDEAFTTLSIPAPIVATGGAGEVGVGTATLSGSVDPQGWNTSYLFQYGTSASYGSSWPTVAVELGAFEGAQPIMVSISNLLPGTTYHYRLVATNGGGTSYGADMAFTTGEYPVQVIQEPPVLRTLLVPSTTSSSSKTSKRKTKPKKNKKGKPARKGKAHARAKHATARGGRPTQRR